MSYRHTRNLLNMNFARFEGEGKYDIPILVGVSPEEYIRGTQFIPFSDMLNKKGTAANGIHFFIDDYRFERLWSNPGRYILPLNRYRYVMSPDFSMYTDMPKAMQIFNAYRRHWYAALMEESGLKVIPTISWSTEDSYDWCFDGEPVGSVVSVSASGTIRDPETRQLFNDGYAAMCEAIEPALVLYFGKDILTEENRAKADIEMHTTFGQQLTAAVKEAREAAAVMPVKEA